MLFLLGFQLHYSSVDRNCIILLEPQIKSKPQAMYFNTLPFFLSLPSALPTPPHLLHTLSHALAQSVRYYQQSLALKKQQQRKEEPRPIVSTGQKKQSSTSHAPATTEFSSKLSEKISENESSKIVLEIAADQTIPSDLPDVSVSQTECKSKNIALLPDFGLDGRQRREKASNLLSRRVYKWKVEKVRRRQMRVNYNWY